VASSALYRYFPSRDALLTALIVDAYNAVGERAEVAAAAVAEPDYLGRGRAACHAVRAWAADNPQEYALVYGSPVPSYAAPEETIPAGGRVPLLLLSIVRNAWQAGLLAESPDEPPLSAAMSEQATRLAAATGTEDLSVSVLVRATTAWTQLFGVISLELFGHLVGAFSDDAPFFASSVDLMADTVGLRPGRGRTRGH
jgi:AcrR family transcriptional regulator